jgi:hypothetical protein
MMFYLVGLVAIVFGVGGLYVGYKWGAKAVAEAIVLKQSAVNAEAELRKAL